MMFDVSKVGSFSYKVTLEFDCNNKIFFLAFGDGVVDVCGVAFGDFFLCATLFLVFLTGVGDFLTAAAAAFFADRALVLSFLTTSAIPGFLPIH
jgi:hypothetical protein